MSVAAGGAGDGVYYEERGEGEPILLIHPAGATASTWGRIVEELARIGRVITFDRRGYARTGGDPEKSIATHTNDAARLLDELGIRAAVVTGTSIGATIAIDLARLRPDLVRAVVAHESPWHVTRQPPTRAEVVALSKMGWLSARGRYPEAAAAFLRFAYSYRDGGSAWDRFPEEWRQAVSDNARAAVTDIRIAISSYPSAKELATVGPAVVCTCGGRSARKMVRVTRKLAAVVSTGSLREIPGAGHAAPFDAPAEFAKVIEEVITAA